MRAICTTKYISATAGTGKTISLVRDVIEDFLVNEEGVHWSNVPWRFEDWEDFEWLPDKDNPGSFKQGKSLGMQPGLFTVAKEVTGLSREVVEKRIRRIPEAEIDMWVTGQSGPWDFFKSMDLSSCRISIDEIHNFCPAMGKSKGERGERWQKWLGEIRHRGAYVEFLTQSPHKVNPVIHYESEYRISLVTGETRPDFYFNIPMYDWYQLRAKLTGKYRVKIWTIVRRMVDKKEKVEGEVASEINSKYFTVYDSFSKPHAGGQSGRTAKKPWQKWSWPRLLMWFLANNGYALLFRRGGLVLPFLLVYGACGGIQRHYPQAQAFAMSAMQGKLLGNKEEKKPAKKQSGKLQSVLQKRKGSSAGAGPQKVSPGEEAKGPAPIGAGEVSEKKEQEPERDENWRLGVVFPDRIVFCSGLEVALNEVITEGPYLGKSVESVDWERRECRIAGQRVRLGDYPNGPAVRAGLPGVPQPASESYAATVQRTVREAESSVSPDLVTVPPGKNRDAVSVGNAVPAIPAAARP